MTLYIVSLEPLETRYTAQWKKWFSEEFSNSIDISGDTLSELSNSKNFLDPSQTNIWKSEQIIKISKMFKDNQIKSRDKFLFLDAWHYGIIAVKYMSKLLDIDVKIFGLWHAGSYDDWDLLGTSGLFQYFSSFEKSLFSCLDKSFVATEFHKEMILRKYPKADNIIVTGFPYKFEHLDSYKDIKKENIIIFPHRLSDEKRPNLLKEIESEIQKLGYRIVFCQENKLSKDEYHRILASSKFCFSASLQETWGIGTFEGLYLNVVPIIPDALSYHEMYNDEFKYSRSIWKSNDSKKYLKVIKSFICSYEDKILKIDENISSLKERYCTFNKIIKGVNNV